MTWELMFHAFVLYLYTKVWNISFGGESLVGSRVIKIGEKKWALSCIYSNAEDLCEMGCVPIASWTRNFMICTVCGNARKNPAMEVDAELLHQTHRNIAVSVLCQLSPPKSQVSPSLLSRFFFFSFS